MTTPYTSRSPWPVVALTELAAPNCKAIVSGPFGSNIGKRFFVDEGVPVIRGNNLTLGEKKFVDGGFVFVTEEKAFELRNCEAIAGDVVFTAAGTLGQVGVIPEASKFQRYIVSNKQLRARLDRTKIEPEYVYYWFSAPEMRAHVAGQNTGSSVPLITLGTLRGLQVAVPPLPVQRRIASILSAYDDLIENNTRRIAILEEMARRIYEEWFVRFRFPAHGHVRMVESELGLVPEGWNLTTLGTTCTYINRGLAPKYDDSAAGIVINQKCIRDQRLSLSESRRQSKPVPKDKLVMFGDVLINSTGVGTLGRVAQVMEPLGSCTVDTHVSIVRPSSDVDCDFFGLAMLSKQPHFEAQGVGSTGQTELSRGRISDTTILLPPKPFQDQFGKLVKPMRQLAVRLQAKNANLRTTRDLLLPKLISGELDVSAMPDPEAAAA